MATNADLDTQREKTIDLLTRCYSEDRLSLEQFESRVERAGVAHSLEELATLLSDMPAEYRLYTPNRDEPPRGRESGGRRDRFAEVAIVTNEPKNATSILSDRRIRVDSTHSNAVAVLGSMKIQIPDFENEVDTIYVQVAAFLSDITIVVPNGVTVDNRITPMLSDMKDTASRARPNGPVLRLEGFSLMSDVKIRSGLPE